jgi:hypothetical protein
MVETRKVIRAAQEEIAAMLFSAVAAEDQVLTVSKPAAKKKTNPKQETKKRPFNMVSSFLSFSFFPF